MGKSDTKYESLEKTLNACGKSVFVKFYYDFKDTSITDDILAEKLLRENPRSHSLRQSFRIPRAKHIFRMGKEIEALQVIINSPRIDIETKDIAKNILQAELNSRKTETDLNEPIFLKELEKELIYSETKVFEYDNTPTKPRGQVSGTTKRYARSQTVSKNALLKANCLCEVDNKHFVFRRKNSQLTYTEPHHIVPLAAFKDFPDVELDREQNVVSLCSHCHNLLHYGADIDKVLQPIYEKRQSLLKLIGIDITYEQLKKYYQ